MLNKSSSHLMTHINPIVHSTAGTAATMYSFVSSRLGGTSTSFLKHPQVQTACLYIIVLGGIYFWKCPILFNKITLSTSKCWMWSLLCMNANIIARKSITRWVGGWAGWREVVHWEGHLKLSIKGKIWIGLPERNGIPGLGDQCESKWREDRGGRRLAWQESQRVSAKGLLQIDWYYS